MVWGFKRNKKRVGIIYFCLHGIRLLCNTLVRNFVAVNVFYDNFCLRCFDVAGRMTVRTFDMYKNLT